MNTSARIWPLVLGLVIWGLGGLAGAEGIVCPDTAERDHPVPVTLESSIPDGAKILGPQWILPTGINAYRVNDGLLVVAAAPGKYEIRYQCVWIHVEPIEVFDANGNKITILSYLGSGSYDDTHTLTITGDPGPDPHPDPDPNPIPPPGKRFVLVVEETGESSLEEAQTLAGLRRYLEQKGHQWRFEDPDLHERTGETPAWLVEYLNRAKQAKVNQPFLVVGSFGDGGGVDVLTIVPLPKSAEEAIAVVQKYGG